MVTVASFGSFGEAEFFRWPIQCREVEQVVRDLVRFPELLQSAFHGVLGQDTGPRMAPDVPLMCNGVCCVCVCVCACIEKRRMNVCEWVNVAAA